MADQVRIGVYVDAAGDCEVASQADCLARRLGLAMITDEGEGFTHLLKFDHEKLSLCPVGRPSIVGGGVHVDLLSLNTQAGPGGSLRQPIAKAVGIGRAKKLGLGSKSNVLHIVDATAGLGEDSWLLAALGCRVTAIERNAVVASLLRDGLNRARVFMPEIAERIEMVEADAIEWLAERGSEGVDIDVVYVDPMFPAKSKAALQRKEMRLLRDLVGMDLDAGELLTAARRVAKQRVVVKRPLHAGDLGEGILATHKGKSLRYDVYGVGFRV